LDIKISIQQQEAKTLLAIDSSYVQTFNKDSYVLKT